MQDTFDAKTIFRYTKDKTVIELPEIFKNEMKNLLNEEYEDYIASFDKPINAGLRINTLKIPTEDFAKFDLFDKEKIPYISNGFYYEGAAAKHPYYYAGLYYIQEPSAMTPGNVLPVSPNDKVLDLCAAPGGKTTQLAAKLNGTGVLYSNDISVSRASALLKNVELHGIRNCYVCAEDPKNLVKHFNGYFDKILVDAPCSGEGMFHKDPSLIKSYLTKGPKDYAVIQKEVVSSAVMMLRPGGMLLYSTCTFSPLENEETIQYLLTTYPDMELVDLPKEEGFKNGIAPFEQCIRLYPHHINGEGHFVALLRKKITADSKILKRTQSNVEIPKMIIKELSDLCKAILSDTLIHELYSKKLFVKDQMIYLLPEEGGVEPGIRYLRTGLLIGEIGKNHKFFPSQAFAMALKKEEYQYVFDMDCSDLSVIKYLKGESIPLPSDFDQVKAPILITVNGFPLGWGLSNHGLLKNKYAKGWRMQ